MYHLNVKLAEALAVVATVDPVTVTNTELFTDVVDMSKYHQALGILLLGNIAADTVDFKAYTCDANGSNAVALTSAAQLAANATANDGVQVLINVRQNDLLSSGKQYVKFGVVSGSTGGPMAVAVLGEPRQGYAADADLASVVQIAG